MVNHTMQPDKSLFWNKLSAHHEEQLNETGFDNFKRSVNNKYFNWRIFDTKHPMFRSTLKQFLTHPTIDILNVRFFESGKMNADDRQMNAAARFIYKLYLSMLYMYTKRIDKHGLTERLEEPQLGNPIKCKYNDKCISQDLCHSIDEYNQVVDNMQLPKKPKIVEIGAGYGRTAFVFLSELDCDYTIVDIHPAIDISKKYLNALFPDRNITYLTPEQFETTNEKYDLCINISSFHEMLPETIQKYFKTINKKCKQIYFKEWLHFHNRDDDVTITIDSYPIKQNWIKLFWKKCIIQSKFFEAGYVINSDSD